MKSFLPTALLLLGTFCFNLLFWEQSFGINLILFNFILIGLAVTSDRNLKLKNELLFSLSLTAISGIMVVWNNSGLSIGIHITAALITLGLLKQKNFKQALEGIAGAIASYLATPFQWLNVFIEENKENRKVMLLFKGIKLFVVPLILFFLFFILYRAANPKFEALTKSITEWVSQLFIDFSIGKLIFILFGFSLVAFALFKTRTLMDPLIAESDELVRKRKKYSNQYGPVENLFAQIRNEYKVAVLIFGLLNLLLLVVNLIDLNWIWVGFEVPENFNLKQFVHEGTYLLIFSILLSMAVVLYFFRSSLNFYPKNKWLKNLGMIWIVQNSFLACSVLIRNYHYIDYHGLAGKRIGMIAFLIFTFFGLVTMVFKVQKLKSFGYLLRLNSWFILVSLTLMSCLNWDKIIVYHNLNHDNAGEIDVDYYLKLSPTVSPIILKNLSTVEMQMDAHLSRIGKDRWLKYVDIELFKKQLEYNTSQYLMQLDSCNWPSWNYQDHKLQQKTILIPHNKS